MITLINRQADIHDPYSVKKEQIFRIWKICSFFVLIFSSCNIAPYKNIRNQ